jgi:uncharacterized protein (DUF1499 family)
MVWSRTALVAATTVAVVLALTAVAVLAARAFIAATADQPAHGAFTATAPRGGCPTTPNCVSSYATEAPWAVEPLACDAPTGTALAVVHDAVLGLDRVDVVERGRRYVVRTRVLRFPDDLLVEPSERGLEVLSASRLGASDLGVNRARVESLRDAVAADGRC